jgi:glutamate formiminotransferase/formiminotetrahydrofolate cyclodeaminase
MASMAAGFTVGREKFKDVEPQVQGILDALAEERESLLTLSHRDMDAYSAIMSAYRLPKDTDEEKAARSEGIQEATRESLDLVMDVMDRCVHVLELSRGLVEIANPNILSDVGVAAELALGAHQAAVINVAVNLGGLKDNELLEQARERAAESTKAAKRLAAETVKKVVDHLSGAGK